MSLEGLILKKPLPITASPSSGTASSMLGELELVRIPEYFCLLTTRADGHLACAQCWPPRYSAVRGPHSWGRLLSRRRSQIYGKVVFLCSHTAKTAKVIVIKINLFEAPAKQIVVYSGTHGNFQETLLCMSIIVCGKITPLLYYSTKSSHVH